MIKAANTSRSTRKKTVRIAATAFAGIGVATALPAAPAHATRAWEVRVAAWGLNTAKGMQVCGENQNGQYVCEYAKLGPFPTYGSENWFTPNWWWAGRIHLWWSNHHSRSNATCNVQSASLHSGNYAVVGVSPGASRC